MTVLTINSTQSYVGDGVGQTFTGTFPALSGADIGVTVGGAGASFIINGDISTAFAWSVVITPAPPNGSAILITRSTDPIQPTAYTPYGQYQAEQHEKDYDRAIMVIQETAGGSIDVAQKADKSIRMLTTNPSTLQIINPTLADDVNFTILTNVPNGVAGLDANGKIALGALPIAGFNFVGFWNPATQGSTPPALGTSGDFYSFEAAGNMTLRTSANTVPHTVAVQIQDYMVYANTDVTTGHPAGWYYVARVLPPVSAVDVVVNPAIVGLAASNVYAALAELLNDINNIVVAASDVSFTPTGTITATNVQSALAQLDASISNRFQEAASQIQMVRQDLSLVMVSNSNGGTLNDGAGAAKVQWTTTDGLVSAIAQSTNPAAFTRKDYVDSVVGALNKFTTPDVAIANTYSVAHGLGKVPSAVDQFIVCAVAEHGYAVGDIIPLPARWLSTGGAGSSHGYDCWANATLVGYARGTAGAWVTPKTGGAAVLITESSWRVRIVAFK